MPPSGHNLETERANRAEKSHRLLGMELELALGILSALAALIGLWKDPRFFPWLIAIVSVYSGRFALGWFQKPSLRSESSNWRRLLFLIGLGISGVLWGTVGVLAASQIYPSMQPIGFLLVGNVCLSFLVLVIYQGGLSTFVAFVVPTILSPLLFLLYRGAQMDGAVASMLFLFLTILGIGAARLKHSVELFATLEEANSRLRARLETSETRLNILQTKVKAGTAEHDKLEHTLTLVSTDLNHAQTQVKMLSETLEQTSLYCPVTGLPNRRLFDDVLHTEWRRLMRDKKPLSLILVDLDDADLEKGFYESDAATNCLKAVVKVLQNHAKRGGDLVVHYGITQFCVLLINADTHSVSKIAEDLRQQVAGQRIAHGRLQPGDYVTIHAGTATLIPSRRLDPRELIKRIESAIYEAKFQGGNRVVAYRTLDWIRVERWNSQTDGPLSEEGLTRKLRSWSFEPRRRVYQPAVVILDQSPDNESINAILHGQLRISIEGQSLTLKPGDCVFLPAGTTYSSEVVGNEPVLLFDSMPEKRRRA